MAAHSSKQSDRPKRVTVVDPNAMAEGGLDRVSRKGSFKRTLLKAFGRKKSPAATALNQPTPTSPTKPKK